MKCYTSLVKNLSQVTTGRGSYTNFLGIDAIPYIPNDANQAVIFESREILTCPLLETAAPEKGKNAIFTLFSPKRGDASQQTRHSEVIVDRESGFITDASKMSFVTTRARSETTCKVQEPTPQHQLLIQDAIAERINSLVEVDQGKVEAYLVRLEERIAQTREALAEGENFALLPPLPRKPDLFLDNRSSKLELALTNCGEIDHLGIRQAIEEVNRRRLQK